MKLNLEILAAYLPYETRAVVDDETGIIVAMLKNHVVVNYDTNPNDHRRIASCFEGDNVKLVLRPLSQLSEEIEVNGKRFIPINMLMQFWEMPPVGTQEYSYKEQYFYKMLEYVDLNCIRYGQYQMLLSWHFDIFGLIKNGLAVDMSQIKTEISKNIIS